MVDDNGNTINDDIHTDSDSKHNVIPGSLTYNYMTQLITYDDDTIPNGVPNDTATLYCKS